MTGTPSDEIRYVVVGDSFSEGIGDGQDDTVLGWADRVARGLATWSGRSVRYANLAIRGRLIARVREQIPVALSLSPAPKLVSVCAGGNDMLRPGYRVEDVVAQMRDILSTVLSAGARPVLLSPADPSASIPFGGLVRSRGDALANAYGALAKELDVTFADISHDTGLRDRRFWSADRLHLNATGHDRVAASVLAHLTGTDTTPEDAERSARAGLRDDLAYFRAHVVPWVRRRLAGRSSGDGREPRHPDWVEVAPAAG